MENERAFCVAGIIVNQRRSSIKAENLDTVRQIHVNFELHMHNAPYSTSTLTFNVPELADVKANMEGEISEVESD